MKLSSRGRGCCVAGSRERGPPPRSPFVHQLRFSPLEKAKVGACRARSCPSFLGRLLPLGEPAGGPRPAGGDTLQPALCEPPEVEELSKASACVCAEAGFVRAAGGGGAVRCPRRAGA